MYKGSIAIDGISLTIANRTDTSFQVSVIPHTIAETVLADATVGTIVNLETDISGRYIRHFMNLKEESLKASYPLKRADGLAYFWRTTTSRVVQVSILNLKI